MSIKPMRQVLSPDLAQESPLNHFLPKGFQRAGNGSKNSDRLKNILGIEPKDPVPRKEKSFSMGKGKLNTSSINQGYKLNRSVAGIEETKKNKGSLKITFIKKNYGKLQPFQQESKPRKLPLISSNSPNQTSLEMQNEGKMQIINKLNKKRSEIALTESVKKGKQSLMENKFEEAIKTFRETLRLNPKHVESHYYLGFALLHSNEYELARENLEFVVHHDILYSKSASILLAVCFKKLENTPKCLETLDTAIQNNPRFYDALVCRGKILLKLEKLEQALLDLNTAIEIENRSKAIRGISPIGFAPIKRLFSPLSVFKKKAIILMKLGRRDEALSLLNFIQKQDPSSSQLYCLIGEINLSQEKQNEAYLSFQQALKFNNHRKSVTKSLFLSTKISILAKDFYTAGYNLGKSEHLKIIKEKLINIMLFTNGVSCLMKKKFEEALNDFNEFGVDQRVAPEERFMEEMLPQFRGFTYFSLGQHQNAISDYMSIKTLDSSDFYNKLICEGILKILNTEDFSTGLSLFEKASSLFPRKMEPFFYMFASNLHIYHRTDRSDSSYIDTAIKFLGKALMFGPSNPSLLYYKSLMALVFGENVSAVQDLTQAIEGTDETKAEHYFLRGVAFADISMFAQAYSDFSVALSLSPKWPECYYNRAVCSQILGDIEGCLLDLRCYLNASKPQDRRDLTVGHFLFGCGLYEEAVNSYSAVESQEISALVEKIKCLVHMKELNYCLECYQKLNELTDSAEEFVSDYECLLALKEASQALSEERKDKSDFEQRMENVIEDGKDGMVFKMSDFCFYRAVFSVYAGDYQEAIDGFIKGYQLKSFLTEIKTTNNSSDSFKADLLSESGSFTFHEYLYNLIICYIQLKEYKTALNLCEELDEIIPPCYKDNVRFLKVLIHHTLNEKTVLELSELESTTTYFEFFSSENRLCSIFPPLTIKIKDLPSLETRLSFCLPKPEPPQLSMNLDSSLLEKISPLVVENKPEAPWIKKERNCLIFTDNMQNIEDFELASEENTISESTEKEKP